MRVSREQPFINALSPMNLSKETRLGSEREGPERNVMIQRISAANYETNHTCDA